MVMFLGNTSETIYSCFSRPKISSDDKVVTFIVTIVNDSMLRYLASMCSSRGRDEGKVCRLQTGNPNGTKNASRVRFGAVRLELYKVKVKTATRRDLSQV